MSAIRFYDRLNPLEPTFSGVLPCWNLLHLGDRRGEGQVLRHIPGGTRHNQ